MVHLIDKDALIAEIDRLLKCGKLYKSEDIETRNGILVFILSFLDTLEVKEVDLRRELDKYIDCYDVEDYITFAKYFFELGLKAQKAL